MSWYDGHSGGVTPGPIPNPAVKSARVPLCTVLRKRTGIRARCQPLLHSLGRTESYSDPALSRHNENHVIFGEIIENMLFSRIFCGKKVWLIIFLPIFAVEIKTKHNGCRFLADGQEGSVMRLSVRNIKIMFKSQNNVLQLF